MRQYCTINYYYTKYLRRTGVYSECLSEEFDAERVGWMVSAEPTHDMSALPSSHPHQTRAKATCHVRVQAGSSWQSTMWMFTTAWRSSLCLPAAAAVHHRGVEPEIWLCLCVLSGHETVELWRCSSPHIHWACLLNSESMIFHIIINPD